MGNFSRRQFAATVTAAVAAAPTAAQAAPQESPSSPQDLLARRKESVVRASEELRKFELQYADEPAFRLVVR